VLAEATSALDRFYATDGGATADAGWRWAAYYMGVEAVAARTGEQRYHQQIAAWGSRAGWTPSTATSPTSNPDTRAAMQVWAAAAAAGVPGVDLGPADRVMAADLSATPDTYWWIDSLFMGLPLWTTWSQRTGDPAYAAKGAAFYDQLLTGGTTRWRPGCTASGLFDPATGLWWRDCQYVARRDALGHQVMWSRGNGWVMAAMARTLMQMAPDDPRRATYASMLQTMAKAVAPLQGSDGLWRTSLLSPSLYPDPETSGTALFVYAMSYGIRTGLLDRATYLPVVTRGWQGLSTVSVRDDGFTSNCQLVAEAPGPVSTTSSIAYCVGAVGLAASEVSQLTY